MAPKTLCMLMKAGSRNMLIAWTHGQDAGRKSMAMSRVIIANAPISSWRGGRRNGWFLKHSKGRAMLKNLWSGSQKKLLPALDKPSIVVMDNAAFHKKADIFECLKNAGHFFLPLPPYSPDFNPIEKAFGTIKKIRDSNPDTAIIDLIKASDSY